MKVVLVLCGGGVKGSFQAGFLHAMIEHDKYEVELIFGSSIGAIMAPIVANKRLDLLEKLVYDLNGLNDFCKKWPFWECFPTFRKMGYYKKNNLSQIVWNSLSIDEKCIANNKCRLVAWDIQKRNEKWFGGHPYNNNVLEGMTASSNLWLLVPPYQDTYLDGGSCNIYPIDPLFNGSFSHAHVFFIDSSTREHKETYTSPRNAIELMYQLHDSVIDEMGALKLDVLKNTFGNNLEIIRPDNDIFESPIDFDREKMKKSFEDGRQKYLKNEALFFQK